MYKKKTVKQQNIDLCTSTHAQAHTHAYTHTHPQAHTHTHAPSTIREASDDILLDVRHLSISFRQYTDGFSQKNSNVIHDLNVKVQSGEIVAIVGASGSGKSLLAHAILGILPYNATLQGEMYYNGTLLTEDRKKHLRGSEIVLVPQGVSYLDPLMKTGKQLARGKKDKNLIQAIKNTFARYGLPENTDSLFPFELSGGMARRVLISSAVIKKPSLVIADEPTPGLHPSVARRVLSHFREMADDGAGVLLITHDLELAIECADRILVFYEGQTIEEVSPSDFESCEKLKHPYTQALWHAMPQNGFSSGSLIDRQTDRQIDR